LTSVRRVGRPAEQPVPIRLTRDFEQLDQQLRIVRVTNLDADNRHPMTHFGC
jgi:hypothetical protein